MKTKYALIVMIVLAVSSVEVRSSSNVLNSPATGSLINQGNQFLNKRDYEKARQYYSAAIAQDPTAWGPYINRAVVFVHQRKWNLALQDLNTVVRLKPGHLMAALLRGDVNCRLGKYSQALDEYERLVKITASELPLTRAQALNSRAWFRATCPDASLRNGKQAVSDATACKSMSWRDVNYIDTPAAAYAEAGDFDSAIRLEQQAISRMDQDESIRLIKDPERRRRATQAQVVACQRHLTCCERHDLGGLT